MSDIMERLLAPIDPRRVKSRDGGRGKSLSYIEAHDAIRTANDIFGIGGWGYTVEQLDCLGTEQVEKNDRKGYRVAYGSVVRVVVTSPDLLGVSGPVVFSDTGYGDGVDYTGNPFSPHELARKEAVSDGLKRALKNLGDQFGLGLYGEEGRAAVESARRSQAAASKAQTDLKRQVMDLAIEQLEKEKPTAAEVAKWAGVKPAELSDPAVLQRILDEKA